MDGRIAIAVRRLNENELTDSGGFRGVETDRISTGDKFSALLRSLGPSKSGTSWFVGCKLKRPIRRWETVKDDLRKKLEEFRDDEDRQKVSVLKIAEGFQAIIVHQVSSAHPTCFVFAGCNDKDVGGA